MNQLRSLCTVVLTLALGCAGTAVQAQATKVVRYQEYPGSIASIVAWAMRDKGFCTKQGLDCQAVTLASGPLGQQAAAAGSVDIILSSADVMMQAISKGNDLLMLGAQNRNNIYSLAIGTHVDQPNRAAGYPANMKDLADKKIGVAARGAATEMWAKTLFAGAGVPSDKVTFVAVGSPATAFAALSAKQVDAVLSWDPVPIMCNQTGNCNVALDLRKGDGPAVAKSMNGGFVVWGARREVVDKNEATVDAFLRAMEESVRWLQDPKNGAEALELSRKYFKLGDMPNREKIQDEMVKEAIAAYGTKLDRKVVDGFNGFLMANKLIEKPLDANTIIYKKVP